MPRDAIFVGARACGAGLLLLFVARSATAGEWMFRPNASLRERYSDNINGAPSGRKQDDFLTSISGGASLTGTGSRFRLQADYSMQSTYAANTSQNNNITHFLNGNTTAEFIENMFFVDASATMSPSLVSNSGRITNQNFVDVGGNRADVINYSVTPRIQHHLGTWATATASLTFGNMQASQQDFGSGSFAGIGGRIGQFGGTGNFTGFGQGGQLAGSGNTTSTNLGLNSGRRFSRFRWGANRSERSFEADQNGQESKLRSTRFNGTYRLSRLLSVFGNIGVESNDFAGNRNPGDQFIWSMGAEFNPTPRTSISGSYGERAFGSSKNFSLTHTLRRVNITADYSEDFSTTAERLQQQQQLLFQNVDVFGNPITTPLNPLELLNVQFPIGNLSLTNDVFISRTFGSSIGYRYRLNDLNVRVQRAEQESVATQEVEEVLSVGFNWNRPLGKRLQATFNFNWQNRSGDSQESNQAIFVTPGITYALGRRMNTNLSYSYSENSSERGTNDFVENSLTGSISYAF